MGLRLEKITCTECGCDDGWRRDDGTAECWDCGTVAEVELSPATFYGKIFDNGEGGLFNKQLNRRFSSYKEMENYAASRGLTAVSKGSAEWKQFNHESKTAADSEAKEQGFRDAEDRKKSLKENKRDHLANARQKQIDAYHEQHGNEGKKSIEEAFGPLPG